MSGWERPELLQPITADQPCGENLEDSPLLASFDAFRLFGQPVPLDAPQEKGETRIPKPAESPEWIKIRDEALEALGKSKDLRLLAYLGTSLLWTDGLPAFSETLTIASRWLDTYWAQIYPLVDEDAIPRRNALNCFADQRAVVDRLRRVPLVSNRQHGKFSLRDIEIATGQVPAGETDTRPDPGQIDAAFAATPLDELKLVQQSVAASLSALKGVDARMRTEAGSDAAPSFDPLSAQLVRVDRVLRAQLAAHPNGAGAESAGVDSATAADTGVKAVGAIRSRQDAIRALDAVAEFFRQTEPSSPIPLFLERAKRLVSKSFLEVLADIAPEAVGQARAAGGLRQGE